MMEDDVLLKNRIPEHRERLGLTQQALADAVGVLERSRHAFRSRELGQLRRRLEAALRELSGSPPMV